jgi:uncharacterized protein (DUF1501 family)
MTSSVGKIHVLIAILATALAACGPTRPPPDLIGPATRSLANARSAGAAAYAPLELRFAEERLSQANAAVSQRDYDAAAALADESAANSELATAKSRLGKAREAVDTLRQQNQELDRQGAQPQ